MSYKGCCAEFARSQLVFLQGPPSIDACVGDCSISFALSEWVLASLMLVILTAVEVTGSQGQPRGISNNSWNE